MKTTRGLFVFLGLIIGYLIFLSFPYFLSKINRHDSLGFLTVVEEKQENLRITGKTEYLLAGEKTAGRLQATENNLGIVLVRFAKQSGIVSDVVTFRLKQEGAGDWYYINNYQAKLFQPEGYFTFGFPPISDSKGKMYLVEIESLQGTGKNGVGLGTKKPHVAFVYTYKRSDLIKPTVLSSFLSKKFIYVVRNLDLLKYWQVSAILLFPFLFFVLKSKKKMFNKAQKTIRIISREILRSNFYLHMFNTDVKKRSTIGLTIFILAFIYRFSESLVNRDILFYATLGGQGDYDQFMRASTCALNLCSWILHQNLLIESLILGSFYQLFGFIGGLKAYFYLMLIVSSIVATLPYFLLSRKTWFTIGGIIGSLLLITSDFLTSVALNFPPDNGSIFIFSMFFIVYLMTMHYGTIRWLAAFGLIGFFDGMFKAMFLINDVVALALFVPVFFYEKTKKTALPLGKQLKVILNRKNIKILLLALLPLVIFLILYSAWEYFVQIRYSAPYFLRMLVETWGTNFRSETLFYNRSSGKAEQDLILQLFYLLISGLVMLKRMIILSELQVIFLALIFFGLLLFSFVKSGSIIKFSLVKLGTILVFSFISIALLVSVKNNYLGIHQVFPGEYIYALWTPETYVGIFLFASIIFLFILNFRYLAFKLALPIVPYVSMLIILTKNAPWLRLLSHIIVWSIILLSFLIDWILTTAKKNSSLKRLWIGPVLLVLFILFYTIPKTATMVGKLWEGISNSRSEVKYLRWVNLELPENAIILAGGKSDLIAVGENINRPIIYNSLFPTSLLIHPNKIPGVTPQDFTLIEELRSKDNFNKKRYFVLESDVYLWRRRLQGEADSVFTEDPKSNIALHAQDFSIKAYKTNQEFNKNIYELRSKE